MSRIEIIREDLTSTQVMQIRKEELAKGNHINIRRIHSALVEIEITHNEIIDITPQDYSVIYDNTNNLSTR